MIRGDVYFPALERASMMPPKQRNECATRGMRDVLESFNTNADTWPAGRPGDNLQAVRNNAQQALNTLRGLANAVTHPNLIQPLQNLLASCKAVTDNRGGHPTQEQTRTLYWQIGWCYYAANFQQLALTKLDENNNNNRPTSMIDIADSSTILTNPYQFPNCGYAHDPVPQGTLLLRGDSRGPQAIIDAEGFQGRGYRGDRISYRPWFFGAATGGTISTTDQPPLAIEAGPNGRKTGGSPQGPLPAWLPGILGDLDDEPVAPAQVRGFVYELALANATATRVATEIPWREVVFLGIPPACITRWWAVHVKRHTFGPLPFPPPAQAPQGVMPRWSANKLELV